MRLKENRAESLKRKKRQDLKWEMGVFVAKSTQAKSVEITSIESF